MQHYKFLVAAFAFCSIPASALDVKACYVPIMNWNMTTTKFKHVSVPVVPQNILAIDVTIISDFGEYDKLIRSGLSESAYTPANPNMAIRWPYFNRRGGFWTRSTFGTGGISIELDAGPSPGHSISHSEMTYFRNNRHKNNGRRGWIKVLHTGNPCPSHLSPPNVKTKVIRIQNFDMASAYSKGMIINNIQNWFDGTYPSIKNNILAFTTAVVSDPDNNHYQSRYLTDLTMFPPGCFDGGLGGSGCGSNHVGGSATIQTSANRVHLVSGPWYKRPEAFDNLPWSVSRPLRGSLFDDGGTRMYLSIDYYQ